MEPHARKLNRIQGNNRALFDTRFIEDREEVKNFISHCKESGQKIVLTQGSFDMIHIGHAKYLEQAKNQGDILIVGVDGDAKVKKRKGEHRPVVPETERMMMLAHLRSVDVVTLKDVNDTRWFLIELIRPDVLVITARMDYSDKDLKELKKLCGEIVMLKSQATTSTSAMIRLLHTGGADNIAKRITERFPDLVEEVFEEVKNGK